MTNNRPEINFNLKSMIQTIISSHKLNKKKYKIISSKIKNNLQVKSNRQAN